VELGVAKTVIPESDQANDVSQARGIGVVLSAHQAETFEVETDDAKLTLKLEKLRRRFDGASAEPSTRYRFVMLKRGELPEDPDA
jgi:hypothetical protein